MRSHALDARSMQVLRTLIRLHIATGGPVGSESVSRLMNRSLSSATIRSVMSDLERLGYLDHPHTSAGRVPTDDGYRLYVDSLPSEERALAPDDAAVVESALRGKDGSPQTVLENASHVLSRLSDNVGFVLAPDIGRASFRRIDLVRLAHPRILVIMVAQTGLVTSKVIEIDLVLTQDELQTCANYLNENFTGKSLAQIRQRLVELMGQEKALYDSLLKRVVAIGEQAFSTQGSEGSLYLDGTANMLGKVAFEDLAHMRSLLQTFEEKRRLLAILNACLSGHGLHVFIGRENADPQFRDLALVAASSRLDGAPELSVGVVGSTRMEYQRVIALVEHVARAVSRALEELRT